MYNHLSIKFFINKFFVCFKFTLIPPSLLRRLPVAVVARGVKLLLRVKPELADKKQLLLDVEVGVHILLFVTGVTGVPGVLGRLPGNRLWTLVIPGLERAKSEIFFSTHLINV